MNIYLFELDREKPFSNLLFHMSPAHYEASLTSLSVIERSEGFIPEGEYSVVIATVSTISEYNYEYNVLPIARFEYHDNGYSINKIYSTYEFVGMAGGFVFHSNVLYDPVRIKQKLLEQGDNGNDHKQSVDGRTCQADRQAKGMD